MNESKKITEGALLTAVFIVLMLLAIFVPGILIIIIFVLPVPFIIYSFKYDWQPSLIMLGAAVILSMLFATVFSLPLTILVGLGGIMIGTAAHRNLSAYETWARGTLGFVAGLLFAFLFTQFFLQINWMVEIDLLLKESLEMSKDMMQQLGWGNPAEEELELVKDRILMVKYLIPAGITIIAIIFAFIAQWISYKVINRLEGKQLYFPKFRALQLPVAIVWIYFFALVFMIMDLDPDGTIYLAANNVLFLAGMFMVLQGFSFMFFFAHHKKWPKALPIIMVIATLLLPLILPYFIRILGIIDIGFGVRELLLKKKK